MSSFAPIQIKQFTTQTKNNHKHLVKQYTKRQSKPYEQKQAKSKMQEVRGLVRF